MHVRPRNYHSTAVFKAILFSPSDDLSGLQYRLWKGSQCEGMIAYERWINVGQGHIRSEWCGRYSKEEDELGQVCVGLTFSFGGLCNGQQA